MSLWLLYAFLTVLGLGNHFTIGEILTVTPPPESCEPVDYTIVHYCKALDAYNMTSFPNSLNHQTQEEAFSDLATFFLAIKSNCSGAILDFLCGYYIPFCFETQNMQLLRLQPCQNLCEQVYNDCIDDLLADEKINGWPQHLNCTLFPPFPQSANDSICFGPPDPSVLVLPAIIPGINAPAPTQPVPATATSNINQATDTLESSFSSMYVPATATSNINQATDTLESSSSSMYVPVVRDSSTSSIVGSTTSIREPLRSTTVPLPTQDPDVSDPNSSVTQKCSYVIFSLTFLVAVFSLYAFL